MTNRLFSEVAEKHGTEIVMLEPDIQDLIDSEQHGLMVA